MKSEEGVEIISAAHKGNTYYFCEQECKDEFFLDPGKFLIEHKPAPPPDSAQS